MYQSGVAGDAMRCHKCLYFNMLQLFYEQYAENFTVCFLGNIVTARYS
jgi:hypothetical protein